MFSLRDVIGAIQEAETQILADLIKHKAPINNIDENAMTPLHYAVQAPMGAYEAVVLLLQAGVDPNKQDNLGKTPLHYAIEKERIGLVHVLLQKKAKVDVCDIKGHAPMDYALRQSHYGIIVLLIDYGSSYDSLYEVRVLYAALKEEKYSLAKQIFVSKRVSPNILFDEGQTPLQFAVCSKSHEMVLFLLSCGAVLDKWSIYGKTALHYALDIKDEKIITTLIAACNGFDEADKDGNTPLHYAARHGLVSSAKKLIEVGALIDKKNLRKQTPLQVALRYNKIEVFCMIKKELADRLRVKLENLEKMFKKSLAVYQRQAQLTDIYVV